MIDDEKCIQFRPIGYITSCFKQKFGIPRQSGLVKQATAKLTLQPEFSHPDIVRGLDQYSHVWILFIFHQNIQKKLKNTVRPPRLGGNERMGVFATRSNYRPNPIGQSVVALDDIECLSDQIRLHLSGIDILDGTPVLDIKPYLPYADIVKEATSGFASTAPEKLFNVDFSDQSNSELSKYFDESNIDLKQIIIDMLATDPRPAHLQGGVDQKEYRFRLYNFDVSWYIDGNRIIVSEMSNCDA